MLSTKAAAGGLESSAAATLLGLSKVKAGLGLLALASVTAAGAWLIADAPSTPPELNDNALSHVSVPLPAPGGTFSSRPIAKPQDPAPPVESASPPPAPRRSSTLERRTEAGLSQELASLRSAQAALASGEPSRALELLDGYFRRFPEGVLLPEAKATRIRALCKAGFADRANRSAKKFEATHRDSPLAAGRTLRCGPDK
jgi:hypothetical protein